MFGKKNCGDIINSNDHNRGCVPSVVVHAQTGYAADHTQEASAAGTQSTAKTCCEKDPRKQCHLPAVFQMEIFRYREKGKLKVTDIFHTDPKR